jgi:hypothetical protein
MTDAVQLQGNRDLTREHAADGHGNGVRRHPLLPVGEELAILPLAEFDTAAAGADDHTRVRLARVQAGVGPGLSRGDDGRQGGS